MNTHDKFDDILNDALVEYREAEPLAGLEDRVLRRARQSRQRRSFWRWSYAAAVTLAAAMIALAAWLGLRQPKYEPLVADSAPVNTQRAKPAITGSTQKNVADLENSKPRNPKDFAWVDVFPPAVPRNPNAGHKSAASEAGPARPEFPDPAPLTSEERAVLVWARTNPLALPHDEANPQSLQASPQEQTEIAIAPLEIKPLAGQDAGSRGDN